MNLTDISILIITQKSVRYIAFSSSVSIEWNSNCSSDDIAVDDTFSSRNEVVDLKSQIFNTRLNSYDIDRQSAALSLFHQNKLKISFYQLIRSKPQVYGPKKIERFVKSI